MARLVYLLVIFLLILVLVFYLYKALKAEKEEKTQIKETPNSVSDELMKLQNLKEKGIITEDEFEEMKKKLLS